MSYHSLVTLGPAGASRRPHSRFACNSGGRGRIRPWSEIDVFRAFRTLGPGVALTIGTSLCACACGGGAQTPARGADDAGETSDTGGSDGPTTSSDDASGDPGPTGPDCSDQTCFRCGEGMCPVGFYCDETASGGPACSWLPECAETASCDCVTGVLGSSCNCDEASGGPHVTCE